MELLIIGVVFGIFSAIFAKQKNRNQIGWFFVGFCLGPIGLLVLALPKLGDSYDHNNSNDTTIEGLIKRNELSTAGIAARLNTSESTVKEHADRLRKDGFITQQDYDRIRNNEIPINKKNTALPRQTATMKCPFCAEEINRAAVLCKHCRSNVNINE